MRASSFVFSHILSGGLVFPEHPLLLPPASRLPYHTIHTIPYHTIPHIPYNTIPYHTIHTIAYHTIPHIPYNTIPYLPYNSIPTIPYNTMEAPPERGGYSQPILFIRFRAPPTPPGRPRLSEVGIRKPYSSLLPPRCFPSLPSSAIP